jgi:hypothetical protein
MAYSLRMWTKPVTICELELFARQATGIWDDDERETFIDYIARNPEAGDIIPESGGVRKIRWRRPGTGKRGGVRVIYFYYHADAPLYLLMIYAKARQEDLSPDAKRAVQMLAARLKELHRPKSERRP